MAPELMTLSQHEYEKLNKAKNAAGIQGRLSSPDPIEGGRIHTSRKFKVFGENGYREILIQGFNEKVFTNPALTMENIVKVTSYLADNGYATLHPYRYSDDNGSGTPYLYKAGDELWRIYDYIPSIVISEAKVPKEARIVAGVLSRFEGSLSGMDVSEVEESIPHFHDTDIRFQTFENVVEENPVDRVKDCEQEIAYIKARGERTSVITQPLRAGEIPMRVIHADPKANNVLLPLDAYEADEEEVIKNGIMCDLDTVMPGALLYDTGDALRILTCTEREDSHDWEKVDIKMDIFKAFTRSYLMGAKDFITEKEVELYVSGYWAMTQELGIRFLADYIAGDVYFKNNEGETDSNLHRARIQLALAARIEEHEEELNKFVHETWKEICGK